MKDRKPLTWKKVFALSGILTLTVVMLFHSTSYALENSDIISILTKNESLFESNSIGGSVLRYIGWGLTSALVAVGKAAANLYDTCFGFVDFTKFKEVNSFINQWKNVFIALVCLSLLFIGILLCIGWDKKPKFAINVLIAVTVVTSSTYVINMLNSFISTEVRNEVLGGEGGSSVVLNVAGANIHDLIYLDQTVGLQNLNKNKNAKKVYSNFTQQQYDSISINEIVEPDDVSDEAEEIMETGLLAKYGGKEVLKFETEELYDGVAWTSLLNEYYYRYSVDWGVMWMELLSLIIVYLFMSYKVIRALYEVVVHRLLAYLYAANLNNNQKILKILDSLKDSYILLLMTTVLLKVYLLACRYINGWDVSGLAKGFILLFLAFAVIDGPNLFQKLTGADIGASDGMGKMMSMFYGGRMVAGAVGATTKITKGGIRALSGGAKRAFGSEAGTVSGGPGGGGPGSGSDQNPGEIHSESEMRENQSLSNGRNEHSSTNNDRTGMQRDQSLNSGGSSIGQTGNEMPGQSDGSTSEMGNNNATPDYSGKESEKEDKIPQSSGSAMSPGQGKEAGGYHMDDIGRGLQSKNDALNGLDGRKRSGGVTNDLQNMERDLAAGKNMNITAHQEMSNSPIGTGGEIFKNSPSQGIPNESSKERSSERNSRFSEMKGDD